MARRNFATVDALLILACIMIFAGGALARTRAPGASEPAPASSIAGDRS